MTITKTRPLSARLNPDGVSVAGCSIIYAPRGQAGEYAPLATNPYRGCGHKCAYCYVPNVLKMPRAEFDAGATERPNFLQALETGNTPQVTGHDGRKVTELFSAIYQSTTENRPVRLNS